MRAIASSTVIAAAATVMLSIGCVDTAHVGVTNVRAKEWPETRSTRTRDVIANGDESCSQDSRSGNEMPIRLYKCPGKAPEGTRVAQPR